MRQGNRDKTEITLRGYILVCKGHPTWSLTSSKTKFPSTSTESSRQPCGRQPQRLWILAMEWNPSALLYSTRNRHRDQFGCQYGRMVASQGRPKATSYKSTVWGGAETGPRKTQPNESKVPIIKFRTNYTVQPLANNARYMLMEKHLTCSQARITM